MDHKSCYGNLYPSLLDSPYSETVRGKVFSFELAAIGHTYFSRREIAVDLKEWDECLACPEFPHCFQLSSGRLLLAEAVMKS